MDILPPPELPPKPVSGFSETVDGIQYAAKTIFRAHSTQHNQF